MGNEWYFNCVVCGKQDSHFSCGENIHFWCSQECIDKDDAMNAGYIEQRLCGLDRCPRCASEALKGGVK